MSDPQRRSLIFGLIAFVYLSAFPYHPRLRSPNELCRLWQARAIVDFGTLDINRALVEYGYVGDLSVKDGRFYPSKAPLLSFAAVPIYAALRALSGGQGRAVSELWLVYFARLFVTVLPTLGILILIRRFLRNFVAEAVADAVTATYALGSLGFSYSLLFMSHQTTALLLFTSFYALWRAVRGEWRSWGYLLAGALAAAAVTAEYTSVLGVACLALFGTIALLERPESWPVRLRNWLRAGGLAALGAAPLLIGLMLYHQACFGHPLRTGYLYLNDPAYQPWHTGGFLGVGLPNSHAFLESFFSPLRGFFVLAPFLLLSFPGLASLYVRKRATPSDRPLFWLSTAFLLGYGYFTSAFSYESWGWTTGPRHLTALVPFLLLPVAIRVDDLSKGQNRTARVGLGVAAGLCALSIVITGGATLVNYFPDTASNALFGVVLPLFKRGFLGPTVWGLLGVPNFWPAALVLLSVLATAVLVASRLLRTAPVETPVRSQALTALVTCAVYLAILSIHSDTEADKRAAAHLKSAWVQFGRPTG